MPSVPISGGASPRTSLQTLEILRLAQGTSQTVVLTSPLYQGLLTHYAKRTEVCLGSDCRECRRGQRLFYRGYGAGLKHDAASKKWLPVVIELTERLEHDMNGIWSRGQVWLLSKEKDTKETRGKVTGELKNQLDPLMIPPPVDIEPPLKALFRVEFLPWGALNNVPRAVAVALVDIDPRAMPEPEPEPEPAPSYGATRFPKELVEELAKRSRMPLSSTNGKAH